METFRSLLGILLLLLIGFLLSNNKKKINIRTIGVALLLQICLGALMLYVPIGRHFIEITAISINKVIAYSSAGSSFIFGALVSPKMNELFGESSFVFALQVIPSIIFITALLSILYYLGIMRWVINTLGYLFQKALKISKVESFTAVTTVFLGQNEIPAITKPFIYKMNHNELFTVMCSGMSSIAGSMLVAYAGLGVSIEYLLAASLMAIPSGILFARLLSPETEESKIEFNEMTFGDKKPASIIEATATGAMVGLKIGVGVATVVMVFVALIALINGFLSGIGEFVGYPDISLEFIFGYIFSPLAYVMGVDWDNANLAGSLIGQKLAINEFVAYLNFSPYLSGNEGNLAPKTIAIISFALCGFANFGSIGVIVGAFGAVAPERTSEIAKLGFRALCAATLSNLMSATIAGFFVGLHM
ncbi:nucleoside permease [Vespertiliibacter pulmonis]|uniref:Nucleoside permease n=1 Tax=Vespertiliibacter pulmonis TaxID=1443036 RepID=A0A3N4W375_9PAST|nr:NupC/NupG family nucleoside CNT transporter [Vespertiliibacter pulmonis]QLB21008.1 nucleoside permease [Vespertiliibacter pulmonis]RPE83897.1 putative pseudouridine transporter [Vespertiliibacter pulmonis]